MNLPELIKTRRSVQLFQQKPVPPQIIEDLLDTAVWAPNHRRTEPWRFIILSDTGKHEYIQLRKQLAYETADEASEEARQAHTQRTVDTLNGVPLFLFVIMKKQEDKEKNEEDYAACACVIQNFLLLAWEKGIATAWKTFKNQPVLRTFLKLEENEIVVGFFYVGYPESLPPPRTRISAKEKLTYV